MRSFKEQYALNENVLLCDSLQSIEYWFLLHFKDTCRYFTDSAATEKALKMFIPGYLKKRKFLENEGWVKEMSGEGRLEVACERAEKYQGKESYSGIYKAIKSLSKPDPK